MAPEKRQALALQQDPAKDRFALCPHPWPPAASCSAAVGCRQERRRGIGRHGRRCRPAPIRFGWQKRAKFPVRLRSVWMGPVEPSCHHEISCTTGFSERRKR